ncbi:MAG: ribonuclease Z [Flavobacteriaceae bacterium]|nr:ribonuclease Z [Flavobacteriaceae bacterium]
MRLTILGCNSSTPRADGFTTSQVLELGSKIFLIDCGEGAQIQMKKVRIKFRSIDYILISHLHGDHYHGLIGFLTSSSHFGRTTPLTIFGPRGLKEIIQLQINITKLSLSYQLNFVELYKDESEVIFNQSNIKLSTIPLNHRIYTNGFLIEFTPSNRVIDAENPRRGLNFQSCEAEQLKAGRDLKFNTGKTIPNQALTKPGSYHSYAYCSDTAYKPHIISMIKGVDVLYHEATFLESERKKAEQTFHSTAREAALIAKRAGVKTLILGHYSARYKTKKDHLKEAKTVFQSTELAEDLRVFQF